MENDFVLMTGKLKWYLHIFVWLMTGGKKSDSEGLSTEISRNFSEEVEATVKDSVSQISDSEEME